MTARRKKQQFVDKKVTDFFGRQPLGPQPPSQNAPLTRSPRMPRSASVRATKREDGVATQTDPRPADTSAQRTMTTRSVAKRVHSPEILPGASHVSVLRKSSYKRARVEETPLEPTRRPVTSTSPPEERTPVSSPAPSEQLIHTSQSDEMDLTLSTPLRRDSDQVRKDIEMWKKGAVASSASPKRRETVREDSPLSPLTSLATSPVQNTETPIQTPICAFSPSSPLFPPTPKALDPDTKAANLIAEIKARAFASVCPPSGDEKLLKYRELDDSDEDDLLSPVCTSKRAGDERDVAAPLLTSLRSALERSSPDLRRSVASRPSEWPSQSHLPKTSGRFRKTVPIPPGKDSSSKRKKAPNPLDELLREKRAADKQGTSSAALRLAESAIKQTPDLLSLDDHEMNFTDEGAARRAVQNVQHLSSPGEEADSVDLALAFQNTSILGSDAGEAIQKILHSDRINEGKGMAEAAERGKSYGVLLWKPYSIEDMDIDLAPASRPPSGYASPITMLLDQLICSRNDVQLELLLNSGLLINVPSQGLPSVLSSLFTNGLCSSTPVADATYNALRDICSHRKSEVVFPFSTVKIALLQLGACPSIFEQVGWQVNDTAQDRHFSPETRSKLLVRFIATIEMMASLAAVMPSELADFVLCIILLALDPVTPHALHVHLNSAMDAICTRSMGHSTILCSIHQKVLIFASNLNSANKARLVSLFSSGGPQARLIGQWLAYCLLIPTTAPLMDQLPPLEPLIHLLTPPSDSGQLFDVANEDTDYEDLDHCVAILAVALTDIAPYVREERSLVRQPSIALDEGTPSNPKKFHTPLERLHYALDVLRGKIVDTRAAHLDRSRVKATIQRLAMRIYYDRLAIKGMSSRGRASTLQSWFSPSR